jgi:hypothetical protein
MKAQTARFKETAAMKRTAIAFALVATLLMTCAEARAQIPSPKSPPIASKPDLSKLNVENILRQLQATTVPSSGKKHRLCKLLRSFYN